MDQNENFKSEIVGIIIGGYDIKEYFCNQQQKPDF
jgi:hypothetical protein